MEDAAVRALFSETCRIASANEVSLGLVFITSVGLILSVGRRSEGGHGLNWNHDFMK